MKPFKQILTGDATLAEWETRRSREHTLTFAGTCRDPSRHGFTSSMHAAESWCSPPTPVRLPRCCGSEASIFSLRCDVRGGNLLEYACAYKFAPTRR